VDGQRARLHALRAVEHQGQLDRDARRACASGERLHRVRGVGERLAGGVGVAPGEERPGLGIHRQAERGEERAAVARGWCAGEVEDERDVGDPAVGHAVDVRHHRGRAGRVADERERREGGLDAPQLPDRLEDWVVGLHLEQGALLAEQALLGRGGAGPPGVSRERSHQLVEPRELRRREEVLEEARRHRRVGEGDAIEDEDAVAGGGGDAGAARAEPALGGGHVAAGQAEHGQGGRVEGCASRHCRNKTEFVAGARNVREAGGHDDDEKADAVLRGAGPRAGRRSRRSTRHALHEKRGTADDYDGIQRRYRFAKKRSLLEI